MHMRFVHTCAKRDPRVVATPQKVAVLVACGMWWVKLDQRLNLSLTQPGQHRTQPMTMARPTLYQPRTMVTGPEICFKKYEHLPVKNCE